MKSIPEKKKSIKGKRTSAGQLTTGIKADDNKKSNKNNDELKNDLLSKLNEAQHTAMIGSWDWDMIKNTVWWSDELYSIFDLEKGLYIPDFNSNAKYVHPDDYTPYLKEVERVIKTHQNLDYDLRIISAKGILKYCNLKGRIQYNNSENPIRFFGTFMDISERKKFDEEIREANTRLKLALEAGKAGTWDWDIVNNIFHWSEEFLQIFGMDPGTAAGFEAWTNAVHPEDRETAAKRISDAIAEKKELLNDYRIILSNKEIRWIRASGNTFYHEEKPIRMVGLCTDITHLKEIDAEQKKAAELLIESEKQYRSLFTEMLEGFALHEIICDPKGNPVDYRFVSINPAFEKLTGLKAENTIGKTVLEVLPQVEPFWIETYGKVALTGEPVIFENYIKELDHYYRVSAFCPKPGQFAVLFENITENKKSANLLLQEKERLAVTLRSIGDGVITTDLKGNITNINRAAEELTGWKAEEAKGKPLNTVFHIISEITRKECENPVEKVLSSGLIVELANHTLLISRTGKEYIIADSGAPIKDKDSNTIGVVLVFRDITEKQKLMENIQRADKLESIGVLAGGIAHDFNNLLNGIYGFIELAKDSTNPGSEALTYLDKSLKTFFRAKDLTQQLLTFSKGGAPLKKTGSIAQLLKEHASFSLSGSNVSCEIDIPEDLWLSEYDENQMLQVINNIIINAQQAMPLGGTIIISAANITIKYNEILNLTNGDYIKISIKDSGIGISPSILSRIFDPFFTTKQKGNGLGLATVYSIIKRHDGEITVESIPDKGTIFHVYLPASVKGVLKPVSENTALHSGSGRILVMDDDESVRDTVSTILSKMGYEVETAQNGTEALYKLQTAMEKNIGFQGAIFDLTIPGGMGGKEAIEELREFDNEIKIFVSSGYSEDPVMANPVKYGFNDKLGKPFRKSELAELFNRHFSK